VIRFPAAREGPFLGESEGIAFQCSPGFLGKNRHDNIFESISAHGNRGDFQESANESIPPKEQTVAGRYRIDERIAADGMRTVFRAFDRAERRPPALKRLPGDHRDVRLRGIFEREYYTLAGLKHPRIIEVYDYGVALRNPRSALVKHPLTNNILVSRRPEKITQH
jgi:serine/threonine protein kinase